ncbi:MAG: hypothetical protein NTY90_03945 [Candidatus Micrarchaeota archaeon]|nr:hypothetical protein [Candidatus Micrarchaeota archaeon]
MTGFVLFQAGFPDLQVSEEARPAEGEALEKVLETALAVCRKKMPEYSPADSKAVAALAEKTAREHRVNSIASLAAALAKTKPVTLEQQLVPYCTIPPQPADESEAKKWVKKRKGIIEIATSCYLGFLYEKALPPTAAPKGGKFAKKELRLAANAPQWIVVKKASLEGPREEVLACLAGIHASALKKIGENTGAAAFADERLGQFPQRNSLPALAQAMAQVNEGETRAALEKACGKNARAAEDFFYSTLMERFGHAPYVDTESVGRAFPQLKIPKPRGRIAGAAKKKQ